MPACDPDSGRLLLPAFGSVTQARLGNSGNLANVTTDGRNFAVTIPDRDGGALTLDTATDAVWQETVPVSRFLYDDTTQAATLIRTADGTSTLVRQPASGSGADPTTASRSVTGRTATATSRSRPPRSADTASSAGAFVDGTGFRPADRSTMPAQRAASYAGRPSGFYALEYGAAGTIARSIDCQRDDPASADAYGGSRVERSTSTHREVSKRPRLQGWCRGDTALAGRSARGGSPGGAADVSAATWRTAPTRHWLGACAGTTPARHS